MSTLYDTLEYNGVERPLGLPGWGFNLQSCVSKRSNLNPDTFKGNIPSASIASDPIFPYEAFVKVRTNRASANGADNSFSGGTIKFQGKRTQNGLQATGSSAGVTYEFQGPWYDLDITQYLQTFKGTTTNYNPGEVVLNTAAFPLISTSGLRFISVGDQIQCILQFVLDSYAALGLPAPFRYVGRDLNAGAIDLNVTGAPAIAPNENTDGSGATYVRALNAGTTIDISLYRLFLKSEIIRPMAATQILQKLLEWSPRTNMAFDYSTPTPTVFFSNIDNAADVNLALFAGTTNRSVNLKRRDDLVPASVVIGYRITNTVDGSSEIDYKIDKYGPNGSNSVADPSQGPGVVVQILDLQGSSTSFASAVLDCEPLACIGGSHATRRAWWSSGRGGEKQALADSKVRFQEPDDDPESEAVFATSIPNTKIYYASAGLDSAGVAVAKDQEFTAADYAFFVNRLVRGTQHSFMTVGGVPVKSVKARIVMSATYAEYDCLSSSGTPEVDETGNLVAQHNSADFVCNLELTNGVSGPYSALASTTPGEAYIIGAGGIAQYLWNMLATPQYEGELVQVEANFTSGVSLLNRVNFTGGRAEWTTMHAQIQDIEEEWGDKKTSIRIGVAQHLTADQLNALLNMSRARRAWYNPLLKADNTVPSGGEIKMPVTAGQVNTVEGLKNPQQQAVTFYTTPPTGTTPGVVGAQVNIDPKKAAGLLAATTPTLLDPSIPAHILDPKEMQGCDESGNLFSYLVIAGGAYTKP